MLRQIPLLIVPFILYNLALIGVLGSAGDPWRDEIFSIAMLSGGIWTMTLGDILVVVALVLLFVETVSRDRRDRAKTCPARCGSGRPPTEARLA